jgi:hypothetical protein
MPEKRSPLEIRNPVECLRVYPLKVNHAAVTSGLRSGKETIMNLAMELRFHYFFSLTSIYTRKAFTFNSKLVLKNRYFGAYG